MNTLSEHRQKKIKELESNDPSKRGSKKTIVIEFYKNNKDMPIKDIAKTLNMDYASVRYAIFSIDKKNNKPKTTLNKIFKSNISESDEVVGRKSNAVDSFCPKCGKSVTAHITAVELKKDNYIHRIIGTCDKCHTTFGY